MNILRWIICIPAGILAQKLAGPLLEIIDRLACWLSAGWFEYDPHGFMTLIFESFACGFVGAYVTAFIAPNNKKLAIILYFVTITVVVIIVCNVEYRSQIHAMSLFQWLKTAAIAASYPVGSFVVFSQVVKEEG